MPQFGVLIYASDSAHDPGNEAPEKMECDDHAAELSAQGSMTYAWAFTPRAEARSVRAGGVADGPFVDAAYAVAGFYVIEAADLDSAVRIARTNPAVAQGGGVEVRPIHSGGPVTVEFPELVE